MKKQLSLTKRVHVIAVAAGMLCLAGSVHASESTTYAPDPGDSSEQQRTVTSTDDGKPQPTRVGSMSSIGAKPSKAELARQEAQQGGATMASTTSSRTGTPASGMSDVDRQFMMQAAKDGVKEVHMGQMAAQQGQSDTVKKLGRQIAADHQKANQQLMAIAGKRGVKPDTRVSEHGISKRDMKNFDQAWIGMMVNDHQKDIGLYQRQAQQGTDPELKAYAKKTLPVLQKHLKMVQQAQQQVGSAATNPAGTAPTAGVTKRGR